jgi:hypothetical protein
MNYCYLCRQESRESIFGYFCAPCHKIQHLINLYGERVYEVLDLVLVRSPDQQQHKIDVLETKKAKEVHKKVFGEVTKKTSA